MMITVIKDDEKMVALGTPVKLARSMMPDYPWKEMFIRIYDSRVRDDNSGMMNKNIVISPIKFGRRFIKSSVVFKEEMTEGGMPAGMEKIFSMLKGGKPDGEEDQGTEEDQ